MTPLPEKFDIRAAKEKDVPTILSFIKELAEYERLTHDVVATEEKLRQTLFGVHRYAEIVLGYYAEQPVGFALFFHNYSTFLARPGIYLEDLYIRPNMRGKGFGKAILKHLAKIATDRHCGRLEWSVLNWNEPAIRFYKSLGAQPMNEWTVFRVTGDSLKELAV